MTSPAETVDVQDAEPSKLVLIVDDHEVNRLLAAAVIKGAGYGVTVACDGQQAVQLFQTNKPDLILMDIQMPVVDGLEATRRIRQLETSSGGHVPIVALTASSDREACIAAGMDEFVEKPIRAKKLVATVRQFFEVTPAAAEPVVEPLDVLLIEDSRMAARVTTILLQRGISVPLNVENAASLSDGQSALSVRAYDVILLDLNLPDSTGLATFESIQATAGDVPIVILSGEADEQLSVAAVQSGAQDYLIKGKFNEHILGRSIRFALERAKRRRAEQALERTEQQLFIAQSVQQELFPKNCPPIPGLDICGRCDSAETVGGDYFDYIPMFDGTWSFVVGDVSGHGIDAAFTMVAARAVLRSLSTTYHDVGYILTKANRLLAEDLRDSSFVTMLFVLYDPQTRELRYVGAGHEGYLLKSDGTLKKLLESTAMPINIQDDDDYQSSPSIPIDDGDILVMCTDGVTETRTPDGAYFGSKRLLEVVKAHHELPASHIVELLFHAVAEFSENAPPRDDVTAVVAKFGA